MISDLKNVINYVGHVRPMVIAVITTVIAALVLISSQQALLLKIVY